MTLKLAFRDTGKTSEEGINRMTSRLYSAAGVGHEDDLKVVATGTPDNHVNVSTGDVTIGVNSPNTADPNYFYHGWVTASEQLTIGANASGNPRIDVVVAYVDLSVQDPTLNDNPGALKVKVVAGTAAASPEAPDDTAIQASVGSGNPWVPLAIVAVSNGFSSISNSDITDARPRASTISLLADHGLTNFVGAGLVFSQSSGLIGKMTTGYAWIDGEVVNKSYLLHTFAASKDTYVDLPKGSKPTSTDDLTYTAVNNGVTAPALASGSVRIAKVVTNGSAITSVTTSGDDSNAVPIRPTKPASTHDHSSNSEGGKLAGASPVQRHTETLYDHVASGLVWSGDSYGSTLAASMTTGVIYISGKRLTVAAVTARSFTASKDTYVDASDNGDGTAALAYNEVSNNAASPALAAGSVRIAIIVTGAGSIANVGSVNQGQQDKVLPIASSIAYTVTDSLGNLICPRDPNRRLLGYRQRLTQFDAGTNAQTDVTGLSCPVIVPDNGCKVKLSASGGALHNSTIRGFYFEIRESSTTFTTHITYPPNSGLTNTSNPSVPITPSAGAHTYKVSISCDVGANASLAAGSNAPSYIMVERE